MRNYEDMVLRGHGGREQGEKTLRNRRWHCFVTMTIVPPALGLRAAWTVSKLGHYQIRRNNRSVPSLT
jgi:hypothetical protein